MKKLLPFIFFFSFHLLALETNYLWIKENTELSSGKCYEVDKETQGKNYLKRVEESFCKPIETLFVFNLKVGHCFEVDKETEGNLYYKKISLEYCKPKKTTYIISNFLNNGGCYEVDAKTKGELFFFKTDLKNCSDEQELYRWEFKTLEYGNCYRISSSDQNIKVRVPDENCKPTSSVFIFKKQSPTHGICLEQHSENARLYSKRARIEECKPKQTVFVFYRSPNELQGHCYEIDEQTKGELYINQVKTETCKNN